jgi:SAM-dependent methyltransferase
MDTTTASLTGLMRVAHDDPTYRQTAAAEAEFWSRPHPFGLESLEKTDGEGPVDRYVNERFTGNPQLGWHETIAGCQQFRRGLMLGTTALKLEARILEMNPALHLTFIDISAGPLQRRTEAFAQRFPGRVATRVADLNFLALEPNSVDLVVSSGTVHHVTNLEYLAAQIDRALTPEGWFFLQDYVGEPRFMPSAEKKRVFETIYTRDLLRQHGRQQGLIWHDSSDLSPFCAIRSNEILAVLRQHLREVDVHTASALVIPLLRSHPADTNTLAQRMSTWRIWVAQLQRRFGRMRADMLSKDIMHELFLVGDVLADAKVLEPGTAFARYRKRTA